MADSLLLDQLKTARTSAKRQFSRLANNVLRMHTMMLEEELRDIFKKLTAEADKVLEANNDVEEQCIEENSDAEELSEQQKKDLVKTANECEKKLQELKDLIQKTLWANFGEYELTQAITTAESQVENVGAVDPSKSPDGYLFMIEQLEKLLKAAKEVHRHWKCWVPPAEQQQFQSRIKDLETILPKLTIRQAEFIGAHVREETSRLSTTSISRVTTPVIKVKPAALPKFSGIRREFHRWKKDWEALQMQGEPTGSKEIKKYQLLDSVDEKTIRDLRLTTYTTAEDVFRVLENRFGNKTTIALEIVEELQKLQAVKGNQPRRIVELIQSVEKALVDLNELGRTGAIKNPLVTKTIESKLPDGLKKEWLLHVAGKADEAEEDKRFDYLFKFLQGQEAIYEKLDQLREEEPKPKPEPRQARTRTSTQLSNQAQGCVVCGDGKHKKRIYFCQKFRALKLSEKRDAVRKLGACKKCLEIHNEGDCCKSEFLCRRPDCREQRAAEHHYYLCPRADASKGNIVQRSNHNSKVGGDTRECYTQAQEEFIKSLSPELAGKCRDAFCNSIARTSLVSNQPSLLAENGIVEWPVIMMLLEVTANAGEKVGTLIDLASDTNYITHDAADRLNLRSEAITLVVHGVGGMKVQVTTKRYLLKLRVRTEQGNFRSHQLLCYGLDGIADIHKHVTAKKLQKFFPDVPQNELVRPRQIQLLMSHKEGRLVPQKIRTVGDLVLWDGPLGKTIAGTHPGLFEEATVTAHQSRAHFARSMRTAALMYEEQICDKPTIKSFCSAITTRDFVEWWRWDSIGAPCTPKCGGFRCGSCQPGGKEMTLAEERELEVVKGGLTSVGADDHSDSPHWHARYPWLMDPSTLPNNRKAVEATFLRTERQLAKEPQWKKAYGAQVHEMVDRRAARKLT
ncbi:uncharacterized protein LOC130104596 [Rhinichthys klamathensis goyatoka]|uniref:uncharacterized protein LOC130104596 n=1 Tax=Rhinichthys klamathensis goyatoka TaxID=3034132 RepID=UPI0024B60B1A|nr:uncharacterized protein LOC130104596 [Rhinichthys klamathensis goyatoka]